MKIKEKARVRYNTYVVRSDESAHKKLEIKVGYFKSCTIYGESSFEVNVKDNSIDLDLYLDSRQLTGNQESRLKIIKNEINRVADHFRLKNIEPNYYELIEDLTMEEIKNKLVKYVADYSADYIWDPEYNTNHYAKLIFNDIMRTLNTIKIRSLYELYEFLNEKDCGCFILDDIAREALFLLGQEQLSDTFTVTDCIGLKTIGAKLKDDILDWLAEAVDLTISQAIDDDILTFGKEVHQSRKKR